jgi:hypothetical protein
VGNESQPQISTGYWVMGFHIYDDDRALLGLSRSSQSCPIAETVNCHDCQLSPFSYDDHPLPIT